MLVPNKKASFYELLQVPQSATVVEIENAYKRLLSEMFANTLAVYSMLDEQEVALWRSEIEHAYQVLHDAAAREAYDKTLAVANEALAAEPVINRAKVITADEVKNSSLAAKHRLAKLKQIAGVRKMKEDTYQGNPPHNLEQLLSLEDSLETTPAEATAASTGQETPVGEAEITLGSAAEQNSVDDSKSKKRGVKLNLEMDINLETEFNGSLLKRIRESANLSLEEVYEITKIGKHYLQALEEQDFARLPAPVYVKGFVAEYAKIFGLEGYAVARSYMQLYNKYLAKKR